MKRYFKRNLEDKVVKLFKAFPIITITGPRQSGKSTLIKHFISKQKEKWEYISLDDREIVYEIREDPSLFVKSLKSNVAIDEAQKAPDLFHSIKSIVDKGFPYKIILSGSANFLLLKNISESLSGRVGILELLQFSISEVYSREPSKIIETIISATNIDNLFKKLAGIKLLDDQKLLDFILKGSYPKIYSEKVDRNTLLKSYITTYIERDLRELSQIANLDSFQKVYKSLAFQSSNIVNFSNTSNDIGIDSKTVKNYSSILETSYQCKFVTPYLASTRKRLIKNPKIFFFDTGMVNYFLDNDSIDTMLNRGRWGELLETFVFSEVYKEIKDLSKKIPIYFWRTSNGAEVDFVLEVGNRLYPIEVKSSIKVDHLMLRGLKSFIESYKSKVLFGIVFYRGEKVRYIEKNILAIPLQVF